MDEKQTDELMQHLRSLEELIHRWMRLRLVALVVLVVTVLVGAGFLTLSILTYQKAGQAAHRADEAVDIADKTKTTAERARDNSEQSRQEATEAGDRSAEAMQGVQNARLQLDQLLAELTKMRVEEAARRELEKLQGNWTAVAYEVDGKPASEKELKAMKLSIAGDRSTFQSGDVTRKGTYRLDPTRKPKTLDIVFTEGPDKESSYQAIYKLEDDQLEVCHGAGKDRPSEFASKPGSGYVHVIWKRTKP
jgi:uncharacterized protein (TIGR03067 family)